MHGDVDLKFQSNWYQNIEEITDLSFLAYRMVLPRIISMVLGKKDSNILSNTIYPFVYYNLLEDLSLIIKLTDIIFIIYSSECKHNKILTRNYRVIYI